MQAISGPPGMRSGAIASSIARVTEAVEFGLMTRMWSRTCLSPLGCCYKATTASVVRCSGAGKDQHDRFIGCNRDGRARSSCRRVWSDGARRVDDAFPAEEATLHARHHTGCVSDPADDCPG